MTSRADWVDYLETAWHEAFADATHIEVALSGGVDSVCLTWLLADLAKRRGLRLSAVHVNHQLNLRATDWQEFCQWLCSTLRIPLRTAKVDINWGGGDSLEAEARQARYQVFADSQADVLALAHHADDQAETVLLQLLRGAGPHGLAAMPWIRRLTDTTQLWRPLLGVTREHLEALATAEDWIWVEDDSNEDTKLRRNFLRHDILPRLATRYPDYREHLLRSIRRAADAAALLDEMAASDLELMVGADSSLDLDMLAGVSLPRARNALFAWVEERGGALGPDALDDALVQLLDAAPDANPMIDVGIWQLTRYRQRAYLIRPFSVPTTAVAFEFQPTQLTLDFPDWGGRLRFNLVAGGGLSQVALTGELTLRSRQGGESLPQRGVSKTLKNLMQEAGMPPYRRERLPLIYQADTLLAAPGAGINTDLMAVEPDTGYLPVWLPYDGY